VGDLPVLRSFQGVETEVFSLASNILVPFSNRISGGGFTWQGQFHEVPPNFAGEDLPIHGDGFQSPWAWVLDETRLELTLETGAIGPWRYRARQEMRLRQEGLSITLEMTNIGDKMLPFGGGFHPWFPRTSKTRLAFDARAVWLEDARHLPSDRILTSASPQWRFDTARPLPEGWINNGFDGWTGRAVVSQGPDAVSCTVSASPNMTHAMVFSPGMDADFFCFEPVSHPVDAINLPGAPGLVDLAPGSTLSMSMDLNWSVP
jgi:aldose 1-epimerase